jgi:hypothetical protein
MGPDGLNPNHGYTYDSELGWVHADTVHEESGVDNTCTFYHYERDGARRVINGRGEPCRIHAYGDSYTQCDQVNDGETWSEFLAARLHEPVRNYGVGGYSVYQALRRMQKVEREGEHRAQYVILNLSEDNHFRNLDAWRGLRYGKWKNTSFTLPHLRVDANRTTCQAVDNLIPEAEHVYNLCDEQWVLEHFMDDPVLKLLVKSSEYSPAAPIPIPFGHPIEPTALHEYTEAAFFATRQVILWAQEFCERTGKKLMVLLTFSSYNIAAALRGEVGFDRTFTEWLKTTGLPAMDMRDEYKAAFSHSRLSVDDFLMPYYCGHHSPLGNFFIASALTRRVVAWLDPKPEPYR